MTQENLSRDGAGAIVNENLDYTLFPWSTQESLNPIAIAGGQGVHFWDTNGKVYLDFASQLINLNIGHQHPKVIAAIKEQAENLCFATPEFATDVKGQLGRLLARITPGDLNKTFFTLGGSDANENALKIARMYTGKHKIISRYHAYHGATLGSLTLSGDARRLPFEPGVPGIVRAFDPYCYRCTFHQQPEHCGLECVSHIEEIINLEGQDKFAAIIVEGVTGSNGIHVPIPTYMPALRALCDKYDILLIVDEVMSGWGRTGEWFSVNHWNVTPDIITTAKGLTSGYVPLGAVIVSEKIAHYFDKNHLTIGLTYSGHPLACAAAIACIKVYEEEGLIDNSREMGKLLAQRLAGMKQGHRAVGDVRSIGLFAAIELVRDRVTKEPLSMAGNTAYMREIDKYLLANDLLAFAKGNTIIIAPPLCITSVELEQGLVVIDRALDLADKFAQA